jgi:hypothetical protein
MASLPVINRLANPYVIITLLCAALYAPFSGKGFHMDSPVTVYVAGQMLKNPLNPPLDDYGRQFVAWNHTDLPATSAFYITPHPPLVPLYLAPVVALFGENELALNWAMFPFYLLSAFFFFRLASLLLSRFRLYATLLFCLCPVVLVNSQNVMVDTPLMALCLGSFYFMFRGGGAKDACFAGLFAALACLTKFTGGTIVLCGFLYYAYARKWKECLLFFMPFLLLCGLWTAHNYIVWGKLQVLSNGHAHYILGDLRYRLERLVSFFGGTIALPVFPLAFALAIKKYRAPAVMLLIAALAWSALLMYHLHYSAWSASLYWLSASAGAFLLYGACVTLPAVFDRRKGACLTFHLALQVVGGMFLTLYASRYLLPVAFVGILFLALLIEQLPAAVSKRAVWTALIATSGLVSVLLSAADFQYVNAERRASADIRAMYPDNRVFFCGRLGWLYYSHRAGFLDMLSGRTRPESGDIMVKNAASGDYSGFFADTTHLSVLGQLRYPLLPLRTMTGRSGFYGDDRLPYAWVGPPYDRVFCLYRRK